MTNNNLLIMLILTLAVVSCSREDEFEFALIQTGQVTDIDSTGATFHAKIFDRSTSKIIEYGFVWGLTSLPTIEGSRVSRIENPGVGVVAEKITNDMMSDTNYYVRAYAINGNYITYGREVKFRSMGSLAPVITGFSPKTGTDNSRITIYGDNFSGSISGNNVQFGSVVAQVESASKTELEVKLPDNLQASGLVKIYLSVARKYVQSEEVFQLGGCLIRGFEPKTAMGGDVIKVIAENHSPNITGNKLYIGAVQTTVTNIIGDTIYSYVPSSAMYGDNSVKLTSNGKTTFALENIRVINPWSSMVNPETFYRNGAVGFATADFLYVGLGQNTNENYTYTAYHDLWKYDMNSNNWTQCADMPAVERQDGVGFSIAGKGYVCLGHRAGWDFYIDLYAYDPQSDSWEKKADFPGEPRRYSMAVTIGDKAYVGLGGTGMDLFKDLWAYDPSDDSWTQMADHPGNGCNRGVAFTMNNKGYFGLGYGSNNEMWEYNPENNTWTKLSDFPGSERRSLVGFAIGNYAYVGLGIPTISKLDVLKDFWRYNPREDTWARTSDCRFEPRFYALSYVLNDRAYIYSGNNEDQSYGVHEETFIIFNPDTNP